MDFSCLTILAIRTTNLIPSGHTSCSLKECKNKNKNGSVVAKLGESQSLLKEELFDKKEGRIMEARGRGEKAA